MGTSKEVQVTPIFLAQLCHLNDAEAVNFEPIPLTEEWLRKLGFGKCEEHSMSKDIDDRVSIIYDYHFKMLYLTIVSLHNEEQTGLTHIEHVHELQNFWYSLAGEELELKTVSTD